MAVDDNNLKGKKYKEHIADSKEIKFELQQEIPKPISKTLKEASVAELISFSKFTIIGVVIFFIGLFIQFLIQNVLPINIDDQSRWALAIMGITLLILFSGLVIDVLNWRDYTEWGALGAIISYFGVVLIFSTFLFNIFWYGDDASFIYIIIIIIGVITMIIGFTTRATELDQKIVDQFFIFKEWVKAGGIRQAFSALKQLIGTILGGFIRYISLGIKELGTRIRKFGGWIKRSMKFVLGHILIFFTKTFPNVLKRSLIGFWNNLHWFGLIVVIIYLIMVDIPVPNADQEIIIKAELIVIISFFFCLGVLYPQRDRVVIIAKNIRSTVLSGVISAYSMLSGTKLKADDAIFCSRCLRGVENREFESLKEIKGTMNPPCPFCGFNSWVTIDTKLPADILPREVQVSKSLADIEVTPVQTTKIGAPATQEILLMEKTREVQPSKITLPSIDVEMKTAQEIVTAEISPKVEGSPQIIQKTETSFSIIYKKAVKKGKFPDYQSYKRAQDLGARNYSELEYIDRLGAPDFETAGKIRKGGFSHFQTFQKALAVGASKVLELRLVEELNAPDLVTATKVQKSSFPNYPSYQRAQDLGASNYSELKFIDQLQAPNYETAEKMKRGKFPDYSSFKRAQDLGALNYSELKDLDRFQAPDVESAKKIRKGRFPDFQAFQKAQKVGASSFYEYQLIKELQAPDYETAKKMKRGKFPDYSSYKRAQDLGASNHSELEEADHYQAPDYETVKKIRKGGFPDFQAFQKAQKVGASSFYEYQSVEIPELTDQKVKPSKPVVVLKEAELAQEELEIRDELKTLCKPSSFVGRIVYLLKQLEKRSTLSPKTIEVVKNFRYHQDDVIRAIVKRIEVKPAHQAETEVKTTLVDHKAIDTEINILEFREKAVKLSQNIDEIAWHIEWQNWFLRQTEQYQKAQISEATYKNMLRKYQNQFLERETHKMQLHEKQSHDELRTLIDAILTGKTKLIFDRAPKAQISTQERQRNDLEVLDKLVDQKAMITDVNIFKIREKVLELAQRFAAPYHKEWNDWLIRQTDRYEKRYMNEEVYRNMLRRYQKQYLLRLFTDKMKFDEMKALDEVRTIVDAALVEHIRLTMYKPQKDLMSPQKKPMDEMQFIDDVTIQTDQKPVIVEKKTPDLLKDLLKLSQRFAAENKEVQEWYDWFTYQTDQYLNSQIDDHIFRNMLNRSQEFYLGIDSEKMQLDELRTYEEILTIIHAAKKMIQHQIRKMNKERKKEEEPLALIDTTLDTMIKGQKGPRKKPNLPTAQDTRCILCSEDGYDEIPTSFKCPKCGRRVCENHTYVEENICDACFFGDFLKRSQNVNTPAKKDKQGKLCPSCEVNIYPKKSKYCKQCGAKLTINSD
ncbi:MAG: hypothetical protein ACXADY_16665 [Candidatus Hodarchaeales archaeon]|jgi:hypothetical protein